MIPASEIYKCLCEVAIACDTICPDNCEECPLYDNGCVDDVTFKTAVNELTTEKVRQMITLADEITEAQEEASKTEEEKRWEAEADYWNDRRCDPEDY